MGSGHSIDGGSTANSTANPSANSNTIVVINSLSKTQLTTAQFNLMLTAMNQSLPAFCTAWGFPQITVVAGHSYVPGCFGYLNFIQGNNDSLGYHTLDTNNVPMGVINYSAHVYDNQMLGYSWDFTGLNPQNPKQQHSFLSTTFGHEIFEMIGDPTLRALGPNGEKIAFVGSDGVSNPICREVCDPVCDVEMQINVIDATSSSNSTDTIYMSNYVYPNWFVPNSAGPYDALSVLKGPLTLCDSNGYVTETNGQTEGSSRLASSSQGPSPGTFRGQASPPLGTSRIAGWSQSHYESKEEFKEEFKEQPVISTIAISATPATSFCVRPPPSRGPNPSGLPALRGGPSTSTTIPSTERDRGLLGASINPDLNTGAHFASHLSSSAKAARLRERQSRSQNKPARIITTSASTSSGLAQYNQGSIRPFSQSTYQSAPISPAPRGDLPSPPMGGEGSPVKEGDPLTPINNPGVSPQPKSSDVGWVSSPRPTAIASDTTGAVDTSQGAIRTADVSPHAKQGVTQGSSSVSNSNVEASPPVSDPSQSPISQPGNPISQPSSANLSTSPSVSDPSQSPISQPANPISPPPSANLSTSPPVSDPSANLSTSPPVSDPSANLSTSPSVLDPSQSPSSQPGDPISPPPSANLSTSQVPPSIQPSITSLADSQSSVSDSGVDVTTTPVTVVDISSSPTPSTESSPTMSPDSWQMVDGQP